MEYIRCSDNQLLLHLVHYNSIKDIVIEMTKSVFLVSFHQLRCLHFLRSKHFFGLIGLFFGIELGAIGSRVELI